MLAHQSSLFAGHMLGSFRAYPLAYASGDANAHGGKAGAQPPFRSSPPTDPSPFRILEYGMSRQGFDTGHMPDMWPASRRYRENQ
jgi:hypothetical protein